jgi:hypothetical protein
VQARDDLLDSTQSVTRALLGVPADQSAPPAGVPLGGGRGAHGHGGWFAYSAEHGAMPAAYRDSGYVSGLEVSWDDEA